jgi:hypothetical protein
MALGIAGRGGMPGFKTSECDSASSGPDGNIGFPPPGVGPGSQVNLGPIGDPGASGIIDFQKLTENECTDVIPIPVEFDDLTPAVYCRGFNSAANNLDGVLSGHHLAQVTGVSVSLAGVTATIQQLTSDDDHLDLRFNLTGASALGSGNLILHRAFGPDQVLNNVIQVQRFEVISIAPNSGARGTAVNVTITGTCFGTTAAVHQVNVSGAGVSVQNVLVLNETTVQCTFDIGGAAPTNARDVTVITGTMSHTLVGGFTVTN